MELSKVVFWVGSNECCLKQNIHCFEQAEGSEFVIQWLLKSVVKSLIERDSIEHLGLLPGS